MSWNIRSRTDCSLGRNPDCRLFWWKENRLPNVYSVLFFLNLKHLKLVWYVSCKTQDASKIW